jgi:hypothetical protein
VLLDPPNLKTPVVDTGGLFAPYWQRIFSRWYEVLKVINGNDTTVQIRRNTAAVWLRDNPTLASGELGLETDTRRLKIGNGASVWSALEYFS